MVTMTAYGHHRLSLLHIIAFYLCADYAHFHLTILLLVFPLGNYLPVYCSTAPLAVVNISERLTIVAYADNLALVVDSTVI